MVIVIIRTGPISARWHGNAWSAAGLLQNPEHIPAPGFWWIWHCRAR
jgi:hypothetical protein